MAQLRHSKQQLMAAYILLNDAFFSANEAVIKSNNRAFRFGDGLFESMRLANGKLLFAEYHADRLAFGMIALKMDNHKLIDAYFLKQKAAELQKKNKFQSNIRFRICIFREGMGLYAPDTNKTGYLMEAAPLESSSFELNKKGIIIKLFDEIAKPINKFSNFKTSNALLYVMAGLFEKQQKIDEAILINQNGYLCETTASNIFVVYQNAIYTPALCQGCVNGIMRNVVIHLCKLNNISVTKVQITPQILELAEEVFLTNAISGIRRVMGFERKRYFNEVSKKLTELLNNYIITS